MAISNLTINKMINGSDHQFHALVKGGMIRHARLVRDTTDGSIPERHGRWAREVMAGQGEATYRSILIELSLRQGMQDLYNAAPAAPATYDTAAENSVRSNIAAVLDAVLATQGR